MQTLVQRILELAKQQPDKPAVQFREEVLSYGAFTRAIAALGGRLSALGIGRGDRVLFCAVAKPEALVAYLGIQYAGATAVGLGRDAASEAARTLYEETQAALCLSDRPVAGAEDGRCRVLSLKELYGQAMQQIEDGSADGAAGACSYTAPDPEEIAEMIFTTGTTGKPKGVMLSYRAVYHISCNTRDGIGILPEDRVLVPLPLHHSLALREVRAALWQGATVVLQNGFKFAGELKKNIVERSCTGMVTVPASLELVRTQLQEQFPEIVGQLRYIEVGAGSLSVRQRKEFAELLPHTRLNNTWGSSETGGALFLHVEEAAQDAVRVASIGKPLEGITIRALDAENAAIEKPDSDHPGRLALYGPMTMSGYWNRPEETQDALQNGWLVTNDLVYLDEDGFVYMLGRVDDIINVGGEKVSPIEVENLASEFPALRECACIGVPDPNETLGQIPVLFLVEDAGYSEAELVRYLSTRMERNRMPQAFVSVEALPRNAMKKLDRRAMRALWEKRDTMQNGAG